MRQRKDGLLGVDGQDIAGSERTNPADHVSGYALGCRGVSRNNRFRPNDTCQLLCGNLAVTMHEDQEVFLGVGLKHKRLDDGMLINSEL